MSRPQTYSHVLATFVAEATRDARSASRAASGRPEEDDPPKTRPLRQVSLTRTPAPPQETLKPAA